MASITSKVKSKPRNKTPAKESSEPKQLVINALKGFSVGTVFLFIFLSAFSFIMVKFDYAEKSVPIMALASALLAALFAGYWAAKCYKKKGLIVGIVATLPLTIVMAAFIILANGGTIGSLAVTTILLMLAVGGLGGILAVNSKSKKSI